MYVYMKFLSLTLAFLSDCAHAGRLISFNEGAVKDLVGEAIYDVKQEAVHMENAYNWRPYIVFRNRFLHGLM